MDMYTVFAITMVVIGFGALILATLTFTYSRQVIERERAIQAEWAGQVLNSCEHTRLLQGKIQTALADRIRSLEVYRTHHTERLNEHEDLIDLLNVEVAQIIDEAHAEQSVGDLTKVYAERCDSYRNIGRPVFEDLNRDGQVQRTMDSMRRTMTMLDQPLSIGDEFEIMDANALDLDLEPYTREGEAGDDFELRS